MEGCTCAQKRDFHQLRPQNVEVHSWKFILGAERTALKSQRRPLLLTRTIPHPGRPAMMGIDENGNISCMSLEMFIHVSVGVGLPNFRISSNAAVGANAATETPSDVTHSASLWAGSGSQGYKIAAPPATSAEIMYRVDCATEEVGTGVFLPKGPTIRSTVCFPAREGAGPETLSSNLAAADGLLPVNRDTGEISVCYVLNERVVCTAPIR